MPLFPLAENRAKNVKHVGKDKYRRGAFSQTRSSTEDHQKICKIRRSVRLVQLSFWKTPDEQMLMYISLERLYNHVWTM